MSEQNLAWNSGRRKISGCGELRGNQGYQSVKKGSKNYLIRYVEKIGKIRGDVVTGPKKW